MDLGASLGPYRIKRELGSGGMGKVYAATGPAGIVALKVVHPHLLETPGFFKRFMREAQLGQSIRHDNVVRTIDCDQEFADGTATCFLVMEYVEGQTLSELLGELDRVPEELCRHVAREICKGLAAIHDAGVVHRDLKPENVLITPDHVVKVMDLGVAKLSDEAMKLSKSGAFVGSVEYAAPEQFKGGDVDDRTDLHALGVLLYELASGTHPYRGGSFHEVLGRVCDDAPRRLGEINPQLSPYFEEVVHTLLVKDPRGRFASSTQLLDVLTEGEGSTWWHERARSMQEETKRPIRRIRIPRETAVYGRDQELAKLRSLYDHAASGDGQVVLIEGEAGVGKSRLVDEFVGRLQAAGEDLNFLFGSYPPGGAATADGAFSTAFREQLGDQGSAPHLEATPLLVPAFDALLRGDALPTGAQGLTRAAHQTCFVRVTHSLAAQRSTIVLIDDLHFAPDEGRALFTALAAAVPGQRVLLVGTARPGAPEGWRAGLTRLGQTTLLPLRRLGPKDLAALLKDSFQSEQLAVDLAGKIGMKSDGNPFFAFEIIRGLREGQFIAQAENGTWTTTRIIDEIEIPPSVLDLVNARVAELTETERDLLDAASCSGYSFDPVVIAEALGLGRIPTLKALGQIERRHRLVRSEGRTYAFDHHQVQEALYGALNDYLKEEYHAALAETLERRAGGPDAATLDGATALDICNHSLAGARAPAALPYLDRALDHLESGYLSAEASALAERALAVPGLMNEETRLDVLARLCRHGGPLHSLGRRERQEQLAHEIESAAQASGDDERLAFAWNVLSMTHRRAGRLDEAEETSRRVVEVAVARADPEAEASAVANLASILATRSKHDEALDMCERALAAFARLGHDDGLSNALLTKGQVLKSQGRMPEAIVVLESALAKARKANGLRRESTILGNLVGVSRIQNRLADAVAYSDRQLALTRELGDRPMESTATALRANVFMALGRLVDARSSYERVLTLNRELGERRQEAVSLVNLGPILMALGDLPGARRALEASLELCREIDAEYPLGYALFFLGQLHDEEGRFDQALRLCEEALAHRQAIGHLDGVADCLVVLGPLYTRAGRTEDARSVLEQATKMCTEQGRLHLRLIAQSALACVPGSDAVEALRLLREHPESDNNSVRLRLYRATGDVAHLRACKHMLDEHLANTPVEYHAAMRENIREHRELISAWQQEFGADPNDDDGPPSESMTRAGLS